ncbi:PAS domain-containing protein [Adhaeribacter swui]|uniref:histidine kinase n=1 Tax=Adhaeribacter swui TaxID=2086471 RepID=A0A7G7G7J5_9BACT|nr:PAS domain-containing protein [Adhaeribacter swui]QNF33129.1 PAS domain-containing protein [Adhaeribacter swui]
MPNETQNNALDFKFLYHTAPCGLLTFEVNGPILYANQTLLNWLEITEQDITQKKFKDLLDKAGVMYFELFVQPILKMHQEAKEINLNIKTATGTFSCLFNGKAVTKTAEGKEIINAIIFKVEDRKKYENELLLQRTRAEEEKQQKSQALQELSFNQAHLIRAPLANIMGLLKLLQQIPATNNEINQIVAMLQESATELDQQVRTIVDKADDHI